MRIQTFLFLILLLSPVELMSQKIKDPIDYRFKNGNRGFFQFFIQNVEYPEEAIKNDIVGNCFVKTTIKPSGEISEIKIINPIDNSINNEVIRIIKLSQDFWKGSDTISHNQVFYIQVVYTCGSLKPNAYYPESIELKRQFLEPIFVSGFNRKSSPKTDEELAEEVNNMLETGNFKEVLPLIDELIKRDPFNIQLYKSKIEIYKSLNQPELADKESSKLINFIDNHSLEDLLKN